MKEYVYTIYPSDIELHTAGIDCKCKPSEVPTIKTDETGKSVDGKGLVHHNFSDVPAAPAAAEVPQNSPVSPVEAIAAVEGTTTLIQDTKLS